MARGFYWIVHSFCFVSLSSPFPFPYNYASFPKRRVDRDGMNFEFSMMTADWACVVCIDMMYHISLRELALLFIGVATST